jgi:predicted aldo/keto reductase-like oxidoreductase
MTEKLADPPKGTACQLLQQRRDWVRRLKNADCKPDWVEGNTQNNHLPRCAMNRRRFLKAAVASTFIPAIMRVRVAGAETGGMQYRTLGRTGHRVSIVGLGGAHIGLSQVSDADSVRIVRTAIENGINFMDNSWDYNGGQSEIRMGKALRDGYRHRVFLMTKLDGHDAKTATAQLDQSLRRLQVDHIDLIQFHEVIRMDDPERIFAPSGALEGMLKARQAGKVRYIGFTGHKSPEIHLHMLDTASRNNFTFDTVQMPLNVMDAHYDSFEKLVLPALAQRNIGVLGMKPMGAQVILQSGVVNARECLRYALSLSIAVVITGCDSIPILHQAISVARSFRPLSESERTALLMRTAPVASNGKYELYKTSHHFDGTWQNPQWLG